MHMYGYRMSDRNQLMLDIKDQAFAARISLYALAQEAGVSGTSITRWIKYRRGDPSGCIPSLGTIAKLEKALIKRGIEA